MGEAGMQVKSSPAHGGTAMGPREALGFPPRLWIAGAWREARDGRTFPVKDPATGSVLDELPLAGETEAREAVEAAAAAFATWRRRTSEERAGVLLRIRDLLLEHREPLARLASAEGGAPLAQARGGVDYAAGFFRWFSEEARRIYGRSIPHPDPTRRVRVEYYPVGVVGAITAWNGPLGVPAKKVAAALAAGCAVVLKPSEFTPLCALALAALAERSGLPAGVLNVVCGDAPAIGRVFVDHPSVRLITFTGSVRTGRYLMTEAGKHVKRVALELGGNAPYIVFADADLDRAADDLVWLKCMNSGQVCVSANRVLVERSAHRAFVERVLARLGRQRVACGTDPEGTMGPLIHREAVERVGALVDEAVAQGARALCGGRTPPPGPGECFYPPTLLDGVAPSMRVVQEEVFGPVVSVLPFDGEAEALRVANDTPYGLAGYVYTSDMARAQRFMDGLDVGVVGINDPRPIIPETPFGGVKLSGIGREGGTEGLLEFMDARLIGVRYPG